MHGLLQSEVATGVGVNKQTVVRWENGTTRINGRYDRLLWDLMMDNTRISMLKSSRPPRKSRGVPFQKKGEQNG